MVTQLTVSTKKEIDEFLGILKKEKIKMNYSLSIYGDKDFDKNLYEQYLSHIDYDNLKGLEIEHVYQWKKGDLFVFDRTHLHSASSNINKKKISFSNLYKKIFSSKSYENF